MGKIKAKNPIVEMNGDEMTRIIWDMIKNKLILKHLDLNLMEFDLGMESREATGDQITIDAANAIGEIGVGVKCATITPDDDRVREFKLTKQWKSPNGTIRNILKGTIFRKPIMVKNIKPFVRTWKKPIVIGRHAFGDLYRSVEYRVSEPGRTDLKFTPASNPDEPVRVKMFDFHSPGIIMGMHNTDESIRIFAKNCIAYAIDQKIDLWFSVKDTISKTYHARFRDIFAQEYEAEKEQFSKLGIEYRFLLIDDAVAQIMKKDGGVVWALRNYDGDVMSDMVAAGFGSLGMMTSVLVSPTGAFEYEAAHGTVKRHYHQHKKGSVTSTNSVASIFAWTGALRKRGELDNTPEIIDFADKLEEAVIENIEQGIATKDLLPLMEPQPSEHQTTEGFIDHVAAKLEEKLTG